MRALIRQFLLLMLLACPAFGAEFPEQRRSEKEPFPRPADGAVLEVNPPAFVWLPVEDAAFYMPALHSAKGDEHIFRVQNDNVLALPQTLAAGDYQWTIQAFDSEGNPLATRRPYQFTLPADAQDFPFPDIEALISRIPQYHSRLIFDKKELAAVRGTLTTTRKEGWAAVQNMADKSLNLDIPVPPWYGDIADYNTRRLEYRRYYHYVRPYIDAGLQSLSLAWLMTGEQKYADRAKEFFFAIAAWDADGITSCNKIGFDEPGLSLSRCLHRAYDWLYDSFTAQERTIARQAVLARARDTWTRVGENRPFLQNPGSSHDGRLIGYLGEQALVLAGEAPADEVQKWLSYSLTAFWTVFPHWGGSDGGWAEGIGYAAAYNNRATAWIESFYNAVDLDMWRKPFFQKIRNYFLYCARPNDEFWAFGDGAERGPRLNPSRAIILHSLMAHYGQRFDDSACQWWADQVPLENGDISSPVIPLILGRVTQGAPPQDRADAALFQDIGLAALHSDLADLDNDVFFLFKSSPYGSVSHSHADQNAFYLSVGGRALAIPSGYYGPVYGMPHHAEWTRSSKANNTILVNGMGQKMRDYHATGAITAFKDAGRMTYLCGDAAAAYKGALSKFDRHVLYIRPGFFVILDDLQAPQPATFQWLLHSLEKMELDESGQGVTIQRANAAARFHLLTSMEQPLQFSQSDQFDTPFNAGVDSSHFVQVDNQWHVIADSRVPQKKLRIAAFLTAGNHDAPHIEMTEIDGWQKGVVNFCDGVAQIWARMTNDAPMPAELLQYGEQISDQAVIIGLWQPAHGKLEIMSNEKGNTVE